MSANKIDILLVDDNMDDAELTIRALGNNKLIKTLIHLKDGEEALDFIFCKGRFEGRNFYDFPTFILLDLKMPKIDGLEVIRILKSDELTKSIPIVVFTSSKEERDIGLCFKLGLNSYCVKPVDYDEFYETVSGIGTYWLKMNYTAF